MNLPPKLVESVFSTAVEIEDPEQRAAYLEEACQGDGTLRARVEALLRAHTRAARFMDSPAGAVRLSDEASDSASSRELMGEKPGSYIGPYKLLQELGEGGMGVVYMAEQEQPVRRKVALKIIKPGMDTKRVVARFEAERQALALMDDPCIARVLDAGATEGGRPFFVMELVQGVSITDYCDRAMLSTRDRLSLFVRVCEAVQHAHQKGIIHRDIKPSNVMVTVRDGRPIPKVIDFGIAKATDRRLTEKTIFTKFGEFIGTPAYMSPEQAEMSGLDVDTRSDVYSLGALLYELLSGSPPFDSTRFEQAGRDEMLKAVRNEDPPKPSAAISTLGEKLSTVAKLRSTEPAKLEGLIRGELDWIVMKAMEKDRTHRYESASALARDITNYLSNDVIAARPPSAAYRFRKFIRRNRAAAAAAATVSVLLLLATVFSSWFAWRAITAEKLARQTLYAEQQARRQTEAARLKAEALRSQAARAERQAADEAKKASREAAISNALVRFMTEDILAQAGPDDQPDRNITLRTVLDRAAAGIERRFANEPTVEAAIRTMIGETYSDLGEHSSAEVHLKRTWRIRRETLGDDAPETFSAANRVAQLHLDQGDSEDAAIVLRDLTPRARKVLGDDHPETLTTLSLVAQVDHEQGRYDAAERQLIHVLERRKAVLGEEHHDTLMTLNSLAVVYLSQLRFEEAEPLLTKALDNFLRKQRAWHPDTLVVMNNLASLYLSEGRLDEAESLFSDALASAVKTLGDRHRYTLNLMNSLALVYYQHGRLSEAEELFAKVLSAQMAILGESHPDTVTTKHNLASLYQDLRRFDDAERLYKEALEQRTRFLGEQHSETLVTMNNLAFFYVDQERFAEAKPLYVKTSEMTQRVFGQLHQNSIISLAMLGFCELKLGRHEEAKRLLRLALERGRLGLQGHWMQYAIQSMLGEAMAELGERQQAKLVLLEAYRGLKESEPILPEFWKRLALQPAAKRLASMEQGTDESENTSGHDSESKAEH